MDHEESISYLLEVTTERVQQVVARLLKGRRLNVTAYGGRKLKNWKDMRFAY
jgi:hypothetical protein